jgi:predicted phosphodiesterase
MRIGVVSDTHNRLPNVRRIVELLNAARVERVIHTGDITQARTLHALGRLDAHLIGVFGNNDEREPLLEAARGLGFELHDGPLELVLAERRIVVVHDPRELAIDTRDGRLAFNPGECAGHMEGLNAVGVVDLATLEVELLRF